MLPAGAEDALGGDPSYSADFTAAGFRAESDIVLLARRQQQEEGSSSGSSFSSSSSARGPSTYQAHNMTEALEEVRRLLGLAGACWGLQHVVYWVCTAHQS